MKNTISKSNKETSTKKPNEMLDVTSYADKLPPSLNAVMKEFAGGECVMVRKVKDKDKLKNKRANCHLNVKAYIDKFGGTSISGWILNRNAKLNENGMFSWCFHSVWQKIDGKVLDVTEDKNYIGRDKIIFVPDVSRVPDLTEGISFNNICVFTQKNFADLYGTAIGLKLATGKIYWTDTTATRMLEVENHSGSYRLLGPDYPHNLKKMCDEYELEIVNGKPMPKPGSKYEHADGLPIETIFDYSLTASV